ncbi:hypothetical protein BDP27DRAFT_1350413 [Rhodocollybia butyracea]|uniref:Methyltransferase ausD n=1 Tax=Rhodocollybia butyracea TaxID=206335 RepID=A0A9P5P6B3_9AGAR|nr:hypothetical protein BDP27DRAFT_1350413 [Rhodocollybia butyracea]
MTTSTLSPEEFAFFSSQIGIMDEEELKNHIVSVVNQAYEVFKYRCVRDFGFLRMNMSHLPAYPQFLSLSRERKDAIMLDIGCCFGVDVRKAIVDGFPAHNAIASDLRPEYWQLGHALFRSTPKSLPATFIPGDAFDDSFISLSGPAEGSGDVALATVQKSLNPLKGSIAVIHAGALFHLFGEEAQLELARKLGMLLSSQPGSMILGGHRGSNVAETGLNNLRGENVYYHSTESWKSLWDGIVFPRDTVKVECQLPPRRSEPGEPMLHRYLLWSVTRI